MAGKVTVVGSFAVGLTLRAPAFPVAGETVLARDFDQGPGGKGSNQAVQAARLNKDVEFVGLLGQDSFAEMALKLYADEGVGTRYLYQTSELNTGVGFIVLDDAGENRILLDPGANQLFSPSLVDSAAARIHESDVVITQLEIPPETAARALALGREAGTTTVLNPAPAREVPEVLLQNADIVSPNQSEARILVGRSADDPTDDVEVCHDLLDRGVKMIVLTRGAQGALVVSADGATRVPAFPVEAVDTTGAGDAFNGTLGAALSDRVNLGEAVKRAAAAGAVACLKLGVIPSLPSETELNDFLRRAAS